MVPTVLTAAARKKAAGSEGEGESPLDRSAQGKERKRQQASDVRRIVSEVGWLAAALCLIAGIVVSAVTQSPFGALGGLVLGVFFPCGVLVFAGLFGDLFIRQPDAAADLDEAHTFKPPLEPPGGHFRIGPAVTTQFLTIIETGRALQPLGMNQEIHVDMAALDAEVLLLYIPHLEVVGEQIPHLHPSAAVLLKNLLDLFPGKRTALGATQTGFGVQHS